MLDKPRKRDRSPSQRVSAYAFVAVSVLNFMTVSRRIVREIFSLTLVVIFQDDLDATLVAETLFPSLASLALAGMDTLPL